VAFGHGHPVVRLTFELFCFVKTKAKEKNPCKQKQKKRYRIEFHAFFPTYFVVFFLKKGLKKKSVNATNFYILGEKITKLSITPR
jgi:hypothetical protein